MQFDPLDNIAEFFESKINVNKMIDTRENPVSPPDLEIINQAAAALTPAEQIKASKTLKLNIMKQIHESSDIPNVKRGRTITMTGPGWKKIASIAALLLVMLAIVPIFGPRLFNPNAKAMSLLNTSIEAILNIKSMVVSYQVRSVPGDNLDLIDIKGDFIDYKLYKEFTPTEKWRIEKPGLAVALDGKNQFKFMDKTGIGYVGSPQAGFVDWMRILLDPGKILQEEKTSAARHKDHYTVESKNNETILTVKSKALGNFKNT